jgi:hypothetical protein
MSISAISAASLSENILASSDSTQLQTVLQALRSSLGSGDVSAAQSAFQSLLGVNQNLADASGSTLSSSSQLGSDLTLLGSALGTGDLAAAKSAFASVQTDLKAGVAPAQAEEANAASQAQQLVQQLLGSVEGGSPTTQDATSSVLERVYGSASLNVRA